MIIVSTTRNCHTFQPSNYLACHNTWHLGVHYVDLGELDLAMQLFDEQVQDTPCSGKAYRVRVQLFFQVSGPIRAGHQLDIADGASLLYRLKLAGQVIRNVVT